MTIKWHKDGWPHNDGTVKAIRPPRKGEWYLTGGMDERIMQALADHLPPTRARKIVVTQDMLIN